MRKNNKIFLGLIFSTLFSLSDRARNTNIQFITSAPTGAPDEPLYGNGVSTSVDWFSGPIDGKYYFAALAPNAFNIMESKTIAIYRLIPGNPPTTGSLEFVASAPTGQCIFDPFSSDDVCDDLDNDRFVPSSISWFPRPINGEYFFTVTGPSSILLRLGLPSQQNIRVYRFNPNGTSPIEFIDSAPLQLSEGESSFLSPSSVDWFPELDDGGLSYFSVVGGGISTAPQVRVYSFDSTAPLGNNISWVGDAANNITNPFFTILALSVDWLPQLVNGNRYFAVGGSSDTDQIRVYRFCVNPCQGTDSLPENHVQLVTTAPTNNRLDAPFNRASSVKWLVVNGTYYLAAAVEEDLSLPFETSRTVRIYEFLPDQHDPSQGSLRFVTSAPTDKVCCADQTVDDSFRSPLTLDWLIQNGRNFLLVGGGVGELKKTLTSNSIRVYEFSASREQLSFIAGEELSPDIALSVDWFPGLIEGNNYFAAGINEEFSFGSESNEVRIYKFRPPCGFSSLSCRSEE